MLLQHCLYSIEGLLNKERKDEQYIGEEFEMFLIIFSLVKNGLITDQFSLIINYFALPALKSVFRYFASNIKTLCQPDRKDR